MKRHILKSLIDWKNAKTRKPLILKGARQVGKTYILKAFGEQEFEQVFYINFEKQPAMRAFFEKDLDPQRIMTEICFALKMQVNFDKDLLIFDEIQACPKALTSLKYFCEDLPELAVCSAGSLLGLHLSDESFPVGKVNWLNMYPMSFMEFVESQEEQMLTNLLANFTFETRIPQTAHDQLFELFKHYLIVGGLPEVVLAYKDNKARLFEAFERVRVKQSEITNDYYADIAKHAGKNNAMHIDRLWRSVPQQLASSQDGMAQKFRFKDVIPGANRYRQLVNVIDWLLNTGLLLKVPIVDSSQVPLSAYAKESKFKLLMFDVGILGAMSELSPASILAYDYGSYKGYFAENFVCQELTCHDSKTLYNWQEKAAEVEFLKEINGHIIPIEVKAGVSTRAKSLKIYSHKYSPSKQMILSANPYQVRKNQIQLPLYLAHFIKQIDPEH